VATQDDKFWHGIMHALGDEFIAKGDKAWVEAGMEVKATADQALRTNTVAERVIAKNRIKEGQA
jgi:hypothetical protein